MGDDVAVQGRGDRDLPHRQPLAEFQQPSVAEEVAGSRSSQKVDVELGGHRKRDQSDIGDNGHIEREIGQREHRGAGDRAAGA